MENANEQKYMAEIRNKAAEEFRKMGEAGGDGGGGGGGGGADRRTAGAGGTGGGGEREPADDGGPSRDLVVYDDI